MLNNHSSWGEQRKLDIINDDKIENRPEECRKVDERMGKFKDGMTFLNALKELPTREGLKVAAQTDDF